MPPAKIKSLISMFLVVLSLVVFAPGLALADDDDNEFEFKGIITSLPNTSGFVGDWVVAGRTVHVTSATQLDREAGQIVNGATVEVEGILQPDGSVSATHIEVERNDDADFQFRGLVEQLPNTSGFIGDWVIGGRTVHVTSATKIMQNERALALGVPVKVIGTLRPDGTVDAIKIQTEKKVHNSFFEFRGTVQMLPGTSNLIGDWVVGGRTIHVTSLTQIDRDEGPINVGSVVEVKGIVRPDGSIDAVKIEVEDQRTTEIHGIITSLPNTPGFIGDWVVAGRTIHVTPSTNIEQDEGIVAVGAFVEVEGTERADNSIDATKIEVERSASEIRPVPDFELHGVIETLPGTTGFIGDWVVSGRTIHVTNATRLRPNLSAIVSGAFVEIKGTLRPDGSIDATSIEVERAAGNGQLTPFFAMYGTVETLPNTTGFLGDWVVSGRTVHVGSATQIVNRNRPLVTGAFVKIIGTLRPDGSIDARMVQVKRSDNVGRRVNFFELFGTVESLPTTSNMTGDWRVSGLTVRVGSATRINTNDRPVSVGSRVKIIGTQNADGTLNAVMVVVQGDINDSRNFVTTHYEDFLNRNPDESGLSFWMSEIANCGNDQRCIELKRINVSAAFFLSREFQQTGFLIYRLYKVSFGRMPRLAEFLADTRTISEGVVVGAPGWEDVLEANKQEFLEDWVDHPAFVALYNNMTNAQFVDALLANAGVTLTAAEREALITGLNNGTLTRSAVLRQVAENAQLRRQEFNRAFVLMQYFGYLRRNPDEGPDHDLSGFNFWLSKLNQFGGNFVNAEMVKAFINSGEFKGRFRR